MGGTTYRNLGVRQCLVRDARLRASGPLRIKAPLNVTHAFCGLHALLHVFRNWTLGISSIPGI